MAKSDILIRIGAQLDPLKKALKDAEKNLKAFSFKAERVGSQLTTRLSLPIVAAGAAAVSTFAKFDKVKKGLEVFAGSTEAAGDQFKRLNAIVNDTRTTLDLVTAARGAQRLQTMGLSAKDAENALKQFGIVATAGGDSVQDVGLALRQFGQILAKGKAEQEDFNSLFDNLGGLSKVIKDEFGVKTAEQLRATGISMEDFVLRTVAAIEGNKQLQSVQGGLAKSFETFANTVQVALIPVGESIAKAINLEENLQKLSEIITSLGEKFANLSPNVQKFIVFTAAAAAAIGPLIFGLGAAARVAVFLKSGVGILTGTMTSLLGPLKAVGGFLLKVASNSRVLINGFALLANPITRVAGFTQVIYGLRAAMAALLGPVNIIIAVVAGLVTGFKAAQANSEFFNKQLGKLKETFGRVFSAIGGIVAKIGSFFGSVFGGIGKQFAKVGVDAKSFQAVLGGVVSVIIEAFSIAAEGIADFVEGFNLLLGGEFKQSFSKFGSSFKKLTPVGLFGEEGQRLANAFATTFTETLDGLSSEAVTPIVSPFENGLGAGGGAGSLSSVGGGGSGEAARAAVEPLAQITGGLSIFEQEANKARLASEGLRLSNEAMAASFASTAEIILPAQNAFNRLGEGFEIIEQKAAVFGDSYDSLGEKIRLVTEELNRAIEEGYSPTSTVVEGLREKLTGLNDQLDGIANGPLALLGDVLESAFASFEQQAASGAASLKQFANAALQSSRKVISAYIKEGVAGAVKNTLATVPFPLNIALAGAAGSAASGLFNTLLNSLKIPGLAQGGLITSPTLAMIGEAGPEVAIPLARLEQIISGGSGGGGGEFILRGSDLVLATERANRSRARITG